MRALRSDIKSRLLQGIGIAKTTLATAALTAAVFATEVASAQDSSLARPGTYQGLTAADIFGLPEPPKTVQVNDQITVVVNINTRVLSEGSVESRSQQQLNAVLTDWLRLDGLSLKPAPQPDGDPTVAGTLTQRATSESELDTRDTLSFTIRAIVTSIRPNGTMVIEAHRTIENNNEIWEQSLWGEVHRDAVAADNTVLSKDIANLRIVKTEHGTVREGYKPGWLSNLYQRFKLF